MSARRRKLILKAGVFARTGLGVVAMGMMAGCASENGKPLPPPSQNEPVPPKIPEPNTDPSVNHQQPLPPQNFTGP